MGQPESAGTPADNNHFEQIKEIMQTCAEYILHLQILRGKLSATTEHHDEFKQNSSDTTKNLTNWEVPEGGTITHNPDVASVTLNHQISISSSTIQSHTGQDVQILKSVGITLTVNKNDGVELAMSGIPSHADFHSSDTKEVLS